MVCGRQSSHEEVETDRQLVKSGLQPRVLDVREGTVKPGQFVEWYDPSVVVVELVQMLTATVGRQRRVWTLQHRRRLVTDYLLVRHRV